MIFNNNSRNTVKIFLRHDRTQKVVAAGVTQERAVVESLCFIYGPSLLNLVPKAPFSTNMLTNPRIPGFVYG